MQSPFSLIGKSWSGRALITYSLGVFILSGILGGTAYLTNSSQSISQATQKQTPQVFVAEEVMSAEKKDLSFFFNVWQRAVDRQASFDELKQLTLGGGGRFENIPVLKIGKETLYGNDLNYYFLFYHFDEYWHDQVIPENSFNDVVDAIITDSTVLQAAADKQLVTLDDQVFNNQNKNYTLRNQLVSQTKKLLSNKLVEKISGESIAIWFNNDVVPIDVEQGKTLAQQKIETLYEQLKNGTITMAEAGNIIANDSEIGSSIDPAYQNNAYYVFVDREKDDSPFIFDNLNAESWSLGEGQMSPIIIGTDNNDPNKEYLFTIIKITKRSGTITDKNSTELIDSMVKTIDKQNLSL
ncbi:hypothetical protein GYA49_03830 [Candidatus Beckwithbacteria bacterium]|nr:hypothetical protein [Candidatus Beckwithbacteria bacterium]